MKKKSTFYLVSVPEEPGLRLALLEILKTGFVVMRPDGNYSYLLYDWRESCLLIGPIFLHKSLCLSGNWSKPVHKLILHENQLELVSRS